MADKIDTILNSPKLRLSAPCPTAKGKWSTLAVDVYMSNPRLVLSTNDPALMNKEKGFGRATAAMDIAGFGVYLDLIKTCIDSDKPVKFKIENYGITKGGDPKSPSLLTDVWVGQDDHGCIFVSVINKKDANWPVVKFIFGPIDGGKFSKYYNATGEKLSEGDVSKRYASSMIKDFREIVSALAVRDYVKPEYQGGFGNKPNGGGGGGYNKPAGGGYQQPAASSGGDDDIPF
jgi:hypothetical protein